MHFSLEGGCLCGDIRYRITEHPGASAICHCVSCRLAAGAESVGWVVCPQDGFTFLTGTPRTYQSSKGVQRTFCERCGSSLTYKKRPDWIDVTMATLDDPEEIPPTKEVWCESRISWNNQNPDLAQCLQEK